MIAKTHVAPLSKLILPKFELMAPLVAIRFTKFVTESLKGHYLCISVYLWSDSLITLHWIGNQKKQIKFLIVSFGCMVVHGLQRILNGQTVSRQKILYLQTENSDETDEPTVSAEQSSEIGLHKILDVSKFSSLTRLLLVSAYLLRFVHNVKHPDTHMVGVY